MIKINKIFLTLICGWMFSLCPLSVHAADGGWQEYEIDCNQQCPEGYLRMEGWTKGTYDTITGDTGGDRGWWGTIVGGIADRFGEKTVYGCYCGKCEGDASDCEAQHTIMKGCTPLPVKLNEAKTCIFCPLFQSLFLAVQTMARQAFDATKDPIRTVISVAFAIYIAFSVLGHVSSLNKQDAPKFLTGLLGSSFKFLIAFLLLMNKDTIYYYVINPLLSTALDFGGAMLFSSSAALSTCKTDTAGLTGTSGVVLPNELYATMECFIKGVQAEIAFAQAAGSSIMCVGMNEASGALGFWDISMVASGLVIYLCALLLSFAFGFYLIDSVVMLGVLGALMTFFIACWPFKITGGYTSKGFNMFMNIFFTFVFMGIVVSINTQLVKAALSTGGLENIEEILSKGNIKDSKQVLDMNGAGFLILLCCCFFGFKFSAKTAQLAGSMAGGGGIDIGAKLGGLVTSGAVNSATKVGKAAAAPVMAKAKQAGNAALDTAANFVAHPFKSTRKLAGVATKRWGQAQKAAGAAQGIAGNLAMAAGIKSGADWINKGENLYNKGQSKIDKGQEIIDRENAGIYGGGDTSSQAQSSTPAPNDSGNMDTNQASGSDATAQNDSVTSQNNNTTNQRGNQTPISSNTDDYSQANNQRGAQSSENRTVGSHDFDKDAEKDYEQNYANIVPKTEKDCERAIEAAQERYQKCQDALNQNMQAYTAALNEQMQAQNDMMLAESKMNSATVPEQKEAATAQYSEAKSRYEAAINKGNVAQNNANNAQIGARSSATAYGAYKQAAQDLQKGEQIDWKSYKKVGESRLQQSLDELNYGRVETAGPRS